LRRLDDPSNAEFLRDLAKGVVPKELQSDDQMEGDRTVGLIDKRHLEHEADDSAPAPPPASFTGEGQSLGGSLPAVSGGVVSPPSEGQAQATSEPMVDEGKPVTMIQVRLLNGKRLRVKINVDATVGDLVLFVNASGDAGQEDYVLSAGFPPKILEDLEKTVGEVGLQGSQVIQKKA
jgi:UBX domain-containing protein 1